MIDLYNDILHPNVWKLNSIYQNEKEKKAPHLLSISVYSFNANWKTISNKFQELSTTSSAVWHGKTFDTWIAVLYTELWCQRLIAHQHSRHLLCLSLHNYTSWSCFLSPPDHLFPAANLLSVPASASTSSPYRVNLSIDIIFSPSPFLSLFLSSFSLSYTNIHIHTHKHTHTQCNRAVKQKPWYIWQYYVVLHFCIDVFVSHILNFL